MKSKIDSLGVGKSLELFGEQIKDSWTQAYKSDLGKRNMSSVIVSGMGGSSNAAKILEGLFEKSFNVNFDIDIHNDYDLPFWVNSDTLVIANSYSGNTEETLSAVSAAKKVGARVVGITTGGKLGEMIQDGQIEGVIIDPSKTNLTGFPKTGLGISFGGLLATLVKLGVVSLSQDELFDAIADLDAISANWDPKDKAKWFHGYLPVLFGGRPFIGSLNAGRNAICEIGRTYTQFYDFPEVNHVLIEATLKPNEAKQKNRYLFFESNFNHERVKLRYNITRQIFDKQGLDYSVYELQGTSKLSQSLEIPFFCSWIGYHLSLLDNSDPGPEPWILELKKRLS